MNIRTILVSTLILVGPASQLAYAGSVEMNIRQTIDNGSKNKIHGARLKGMLSGEAARREVDVIGKDKADCSTVIGSQNVDNSIIGAKEEIIITTPVYNICTI